MGDSHRTPALQQMDGVSAEPYGPTSFLDYLRDTGKDPGNYRTAAEISIDTRRDLANELALHDTMVFRLGRSPEGWGTQFALVNVPASWAISSSTKPRSPPTSERTSTFHSESSVDVRRDMTTQTTRVGFFDENVCGS